jgi:hypothetical protein
VAIGDDKNDVIEYSFPIVDFSGERDQSQSTVTGPPASLCSPQHASAPGNKHARFFRSTGEYIVGVGGGGGLFIIFGQRKQLLLPQLEQRKRRAGASNA